MTVTYNVQMKKIYISAPDEPIIEYKVLMESSAFYHLSSADILSHHPICHKGFSKDFKVQTISW